MKRGKGVPYAKVDITDAPGGVVCKDRAAETDEHGEATLILSGVQPEPTEIIVMTNNVPSFKEKNVKTKDVAFATVDLYIVLTSELFLQVTKSGTGGGTVTSSPGDNSTSRGMVPAKVGIAAKPSAPAPRSP